MDETAIRHVLGEILSPVRARVMDTVVGVSAKTEQNFSTNRNLIIFIIVVSRD